MDEKRMPFMNFKIATAKKLKVEFKKTTKIWHMYSLRFSSLAATQRYKRSFVKKKNHGNQIKESGVAYAIN